MYISFVCVAWTIYLAIFDKAGFQHWVRVMELEGQCEVELSNFNLHPEFPFVLNSASHCS